VITEASHLTGQPAAILEMLSEQSLRIGLDVEEQAAGISALIAKYGKRMDLADACIVRMSELAKRCVIITVDQSDFTFYRRNGREVIPLIAPDSE
jgi:predicted nucleic acid-binding protein